MTSPQTRLTMGFNLQAHGGEELMFGTVSDWRPTFVLTFTSFNKDDPTNIGMRMRSHVQPWGGSIAHRVYTGFEQRFWQRSVADDERATLREIPNDVWVHIGNEPDAAPADIEAACGWVETRMARATASGTNQRCIFYNAAPSTWGWDALKQGRYDRMLIALAKHADDIVDAQGNARFMLGVHDRWGGNPVCNIDGADPRDMQNRTKVQPPWKEPADVLDEDESNNWTILRSRWFLLRLEELYRLGKVARPRNPVQIFVSEFGPEDMSGDLGQFPELMNFLMSYTGGKPYGMPTLNNLMRFWYPQWSVAQAHCELYNWVLSLYPAYYRAFAIYQWTTHNAPPDFWQDRFSPHKMGDFLKLWPAYGKLPSPLPVPAPTPTPTPTPVPTPDPMLAERKRIADRLRALAGDVEGGKV